jgi:hypothetical protein
VHRHGSRYLAAWLIERVTDTPRDHRPLTVFLRRRYGVLEGLTS